MPLSIGARSDNNMPTTKFLGLTCAPDEWNELPETLRATIIQRISEIQRLYSGDGVYERYHSNTQNGYRNFLTMLYLLYQIH